MQAEYYYDLVLQAAPRATSKGVLRSLTTDSGKSRTSGHSTRACCPKTIEPSIPSILSSQIYRNNENGLVCSSPTFEAHAWTPAFDHLRSTKTSKQIVIESAVRLAQLIAIVHPTSRLPGALNHLRLAYGLNRNSPRVLCSLTDLGYIQGIK